MLSSLNGYDLCGYVGSTLFVIMYFLNIKGTVDTQGFLYPITNLLGCCFMMISLWHDFNKAAFLIEIFWAFASIYGIIETMWHRWR
ncbi:MAG: hypothetical protein J6P47_03090 [Acetobacter sp.]|nr:hypothetical protein [Acetobacter sp.]MBO6035613.1 hypothetical protein [Acetobacter sp.]MBO6043430.1 hypothetical protein [Acetobacter sp.]MBO6086594.1 hypothetical protein [Acetobacter sp.]MBQ5469572.1 hypothetical protein [Acetobacter sp.]